MTKVLGIALALCAVLAGSAAARVCHPLPLGARVAIVQGDVLGYTLKGANVDVVFDSSDCPLVARWALRSGPSRRTLTPAAATCAPGASSRATAVRIPAEHTGALEASGGSWRAEVDGTTVRLYSAGTLAHSFTRAGDTTVGAAVIHQGLLALVTDPQITPDKPATLELYALRSGNLLHRWPLVGAAATFDLDAGVAVYSVRHRDAAFALRLRDGATTLISPIRAGDVPQVDSSGVVYEDAMVPAQRRPGRFALTFVPMRAVTADFRMTFHRLVTPGTITSLAVDGPTVAVSFHSARRSCDQVRIWQSLWHDVATPTKEDDEGWSCRGRTAISTVTAGGISANWIARSRSSVRLVSASSVNCVQHLLAMLDPTRTQLTAVAAKGGVVAFALLRADGTPTLRLRATDGTWHTIPLAAAPQGISIDARTVAVWTPDGTVRVFAESGEPVATLHVDAPRAVALRSGRLVVLTGRRTLNVFDVASATRVLERRLPALAAPAISVSFGIAVLSSGDRVYALRLSDGRLATIARAPAAVTARIGDAGIAYAWSSGGRGTVMFVPLRAVQSALAGSSRTAAEG